MFYGTTVRYQKGNRCSIGRRCAQLTQAAHSYSSYLALPGIPRAIRSEHKPGFNLEQVPLQSLDYSDLSTSLGYAMKKISSI